MTGLGPKPGPIQINMMTYSLSCYFIILIESAVKLIFDFSTKILNRKILRIQNQVMVWKLLSRLIQRFYPWIFYSQVLQNSSPFRSISNNRSFGHEEVDWLLTDNFFEVSASFYQLWIYFQKLYDGFLELIVCLSGLESRYGVLTGDQVIFTDFGLTWSSLLGWTAVTT